MHEISWGHGRQTAASTIAEKIKAAAAKVARLGWVVDVFCDIRSWGAMADMIRGLPVGVKLVADHCGCTYPGEEKLEEFEKFISLVRDGLLYVKLSGFDRLYPGHEGGMAAMEPIVKAIVQAGPTRVVYGSGKLEAHFIGVHYD
jgi:predicted TIM-barrel fold metal-dependent hydrolase